MAESSRHVFASALRGAHAGSRQEPSEATEEGAAHDAKALSAAPRLCISSFGASDRRVPLAPPRRSDFRKTLLNSPVAFQDEEDGPADKARHAWFGPARLGWLGS